MRESECMCVCIIMLSLTVYILCVSCLKMMGNPVNYYFLISCSKGESSIYIFIINKDVSGLTHVPFGHCNCFPKTYEGVFNPYSTGSQLAALLR